MSLRSILCHAIAAAAAARSFLGLLPPQAWLRLTCQRSAEELGKTAAQNSHGYSLPRSGWLVTWTFRPRDVLNVFRQTPHSCRGGCCLPRELEEEPTASVSCCSGAWISAARACSSSVTTSCSAGSTLFGPTATAGDGGTCCLGVRLGVVVVTMSAGANTGEGDCTVRITSSRPTLARAAATTGVEGGLGATTSTEAAGAWLATAAAGAAWWATSGAAGAGGSATSSARNARGGSSRTPRDSIKRETARHSSSGLSAKKTIHV